MSSKDRMESLIKTKNKLIDQKKPLQKKKNDEIATPEELEKLAEINKEIRECEKKVRKIKNNTPKKYPSKKKYSKKNKVVEEKQDKLEKEPKTNEEVPEDIEAFLEDVNKHIEKIEVLAKEFDAREKEITEQFEKRINTEIPKKKEHKNPKAEEKEIKSEPKTDEDIAEEFEKRSDTEIPKKEEAKNPKAEEKEIKSEPKTEEKIEVSEEQIVVEGEKGSQEPLNEHSKKSSEELKTKDSDSETSKDKKNAEVKKETVKTEKSKNIEDTYIYDVNYGLDDWEIEKFNELKDDLEITTDEKEKENIRKKMAKILDGKQSLNVSIEDRTQENNTSKDVKSAMKEIQETLAKGNLSKEEVESEYVKFQKLKNAQSKKSEEKDNENNHENEVVVRTREDIERDLSELGDDYWSGDEKYKKYLELMIELGQKDKEETRERTKEEPTVPEEKDSKPENNKIAKVNWWNRIASWGKKQFNRIKNLTSRRKNKKEIEKITTEVVSDLDDEKFNEIAKNVKLETEKIEQDVKRESELQKSNDFVVERNIVYTGANPEDLKNMDETIRRMETKKSRRTERDDDEVK